MVRCFFQSRNFPWPRKGENKYFSWDDSIAGALFPTFSPRWNLCLKIPVSWETRAFSSRPFAVKSWRWSLWRLNLALCVCWPDQDNRRVKDWPLPCFPDSAGPWALKPNSLYSVVERRTRLGPAGSFSDISQSLSAFISCRLQLCQSHDLSSSFLLSELWLLHTGPVPTRGQSSHYTQMSHLSWPK